jgi:hypothetical protein
MKVHEEYIKERLGTSKVEIEYIKAHEMFADLLTKPLSSELYHKLVSKILGRCQFACLNNRGAKGKLVCTNTYNKSSVESVMPVLANLTCSNQAKMTTKHRAVITAHNMKVK